jgi:hypothetical protein
MIPISLKFREIVDVNTCEIGESDIPKTDRRLTLSECEHKANFCESCLHHYAIYKVNMYEEVFCPHEGCNALINTKGDFFKQLSTDIQKNYRKVHQFFVTSKDPSKKLCPKENCKGIIQAKTEGMMTCDTCRDNFCSKCILKNH